MRNSIWMVKMGLVVSLLVGGCGKDAGGVRPGSSDKPDMTVVFPPDDRDMGEGGGEVDFGEGGSDVCGDPFPDPDCHDNGYGPPNSQLPLQSDNMRDPAEGDNGVSRDVNGYLKLDSTHSVFNYLWIANWQDLAQAGTVSKIDSKTVRETARYYSVTCYSLKTGSTQQCDGANGCCSIDDWQRYQARKNKMPEPPHQAVQRGSNAPSRTSVDFNGDLFIANRAFGGQSSVTKIANDLTECIDRNHNGRIDTSADTDGNGFIEVDCNGDGQPDDVATVQGKPCGNGLKQEFYGTDDECILWTSNTFVNNAWGRPLGLGAGDTQISDAWAGSYNNGNFVRIDGVTGKGKADAQLPQGCSPYGLAIDASGIGWAPNLSSGKLCYFDTKKPANVGAVRDPQWGPMVGYGVTLDRDQNVWVGMQVARYTPDRSNGFNNLGNGWWTRLGNLGGIGIAADARNAKDYYVYSCNGSNTVTQIPASGIKTMKADQQIPNPGWPTITMPCYGVGVDSDQNVWGVSMGMSTRAVVNGQGVITAPTLNMPPAGKNKCPAGDQCPNAGAYTYSDFTGFGLRNFTRPTGSYTMVVPGCKDVSTGQPADTLWYTVEWDADVPPSTSLSVAAKASSGAVLRDPAWGQASWSNPSVVSPLELQNNLTPNLAPGDPPGTVVRDEYLMVEFTFKTQAQNATPKLKSFRVGYKCERIEG